MEPAKTLPVADRLDGLETEVRRLRLLAAVLIVATLALGGNAALSRPRPGRTLVAGGLEIRDAEGRLRGTFGLDHYQLPGLKLYDQRGGEQVTLAIPSDDTSALYFFDRGWPRVALESSIEGTASFRLVDKEAKDRAVMTLAPDGTPTMAVADRPEGLARESAETATASPAPPIDLVGPPPLRSIAEPGPSPQPTAPLTPRVPTRISQRGSALRQAEL
ncbi:MAG TPA: hypothetical protein VGH33_28640 [Isosphaeraceae bacterium]|jgi:hypothetical protein